MNTRETRSQQSFKQPLTLSRQHQSHRVVKKRKPFHPRSRSNPPNSPLLILEWSLYSRSPLGVSIFLLLTANRVARQRRGKQKDTEFQKAKAKRIPWTSFLQKFSTLLSERSQSQKAACCMVPCNVQNGQIHRDRKYMVSWGSEELGKLGV